MIEILLAAAAGLLSGLIVGGLVHRARYRAWNAERALLKAQIEDDEGITDINFDEIVETTLRNRAMGVEPIGLAALLVRRSEMAPSGINHAANEFWSSGPSEPTYGDLVPPLEECDCQFCDMARRAPGPKSVLHSSGPSEPTYGDLVPPLEECDCAYCVRGRLAAGQGPMFHIIPGGK